MNTTENDWIKDSERTAGINDLPVEVIRPDGHRYITYQWPPITHVTHWRKLCAPPPKEKTQREEDEDARQHFITSNTVRGANYGEFGASHWTIEPKPHEVWHAALAYRDKQNAEDLGEKVWPSGSEHFLVPQTTYARLRRRCGLDR